MESHCLIADRWEKVQLLFFPANHLPAGESEHTCLCWARDGKPTDEMSMLILPQRDSKHCCLLSWRPRRGVEDYIFTKPNCNLRGRRYSFLPLVFGYIRFNIAKKDVLLLSFPFLGSLVRENQLLQELFCLCPLEVWGWMLLQCSVWNISEAIRNPGNSLPCYSSRTDVTEKITFFPSFSLPMPICC